MSDNEKYPWKVCRCGVTVNLSQTKCPMEMAWPDIKHCLTEKKLSLRQLCNKSSKKLFWPSDLTHPQIVMINNKRPPG